MLSFSSPRVCWRHTAPFLMGEFAAILVAKKKGNKNLVVVDVKCNFAHTELKKNVNTRKRSIHEYSDISLAGTMI